MPLRGLYELTRVTARLKRVFGNIQVPACIVQATADRVVAPDTANIAYDKLNSEVKEIHWVEIFHNKNVVWVL